MPTSQQPKLFVVDGSNIATEGRSQPSLDQLNDAVLAFIDEHPGVEITVVVDATFGHRISNKETKAFDEAVANNELVTPPAGAIGRGDAFVLSIANKARAGVLSNDSFQEFHGDYDWLFDEGRLVGGKPVPHVGWVFVTRTPVRGPKSRQAVKEAKQSDRTESKQKANRRVRSKQSGDADNDDTSSDSSGASASSGSSTASGDGAKRSSGRGRRKRADAPSDEPSSASSAESTGGPSPSKDHVNDLMPFLEFVENHPVGTSCTVQVESYASHGAYARTGDVLIYIPLRLMDDPAPRSARSALTVGDAIAVVIVGFTPDRRSIDAALPHMAADHTSAKAGSEPSSGADVGDARPPATKRATKKATAKKTPAKKTPAKKTAAKKTPAKKAAANKAAAKKTPATKTAAKKAAAKKTAAKKAAAKKTAAKKTPAEKRAAKKAPAKKTGAKESMVANRSAAKKVAAKKAPARKRSAAKPTSD